MANGRRDFLCLDDVKSLEETKGKFLRDKYDGTIAFRIRVPPSLRAAFDRNEIQMLIPAKVRNKGELAGQLGACCKEVFERMEGVADMVDAFNPGKVRKVLREYMQETIKEWREGPPLDNDDNGIVRWNRSKTTSKIWKNGYRRLLSSFSSSRRKATG